MAIAISDSATVIVEEYTRGDFRLIVFGDKRRKVQFTNCEVNEPCQIDEVMISDAFAAYKYLNICHAVFGNITCSTTNEKISHNNCEEITEKLLMRNRRK